MPESLSAIVFLFFLTLRDILSPRLPCADVGVALPTELDD